MARSLDPLLPERGKSRVAAVAAVGGLFTFSPPGRRWPEGPDEGWALAKALMARAL
jgi:hypothetical protein